MSVIKFNRNFSELFNWDSDADPTTEQEYQGAVKNWTETEMNIVDTLLWQPETDYTEENIVKTPSLPLHYVLVCTTGGTSGATEPSYNNVQIGDIVTDGTVEWTVTKLAVGDIPVVSDRSKVDASNIGVNAETDNSELWGSAIGGGAVAEDDGKLVTGGTVHAVTSVLASDIADNTDDIATNTENIAQNTTDIDIADKRISNIEKLLQGNLYDYQTDTDSAYTKSVPSGAMPYAGLEKVGGKTIVWNQLSQANRTSITAFGCSYNVTNGLFTIQGTWSGDTTSQFRVGNTNVPLPSGHKVYYSCSNPNIKIHLQGNSFAAETKAYVTIPNNTTVADVVVEMGVESGTVVDTSAYFNIIDLTFMFGAGNEPSTVAEFESMFPADYYAYNAGTLLSAGVTEVVSNSNNLLRNATLQQGTVTLQYDDGNSSANRVRTDYIAIEENTEYTASVLSTGSVQIFYIFYYNSSKTGLSYVDISSKSTTVTTPANASYIRISYNISGDINLVPSDVKDAYLSENPNKVVATYPIPTAIRNLEGYGWSAGSVSNYIDFERKVFVKNVEKVDLGTLGWVWQSAYGMFASNPGTHDNTKTMINNPSGITCTRYVFKGGYNAITDMSCGYIYYNNIAVKDDSFNGDTSAFTSAMSGIYACYPLATPQEIDISEYLTDDNLINVEAGGTLTFPNSNGDDYRIPVPSEEEYMIDLQSAIGG